MKKKTNNDNGTVYYNYLRYLLLGIRYTRRKVFLFTKKISTIQYHCCNRQPERRRLVRQLLHH